MKKRFSLVTVVAFLLLVAASSSLITFSITKDILNSKLLQDKEQEIEMLKFIEAKKLITDSFVGTIDEKHLLDGAIKGMVESLGDRWSEYLDEESYRIYTSDNHTLVGIGATYAWQPDKGGIRIVEIYKESQALNKGISPLDIITKIGNENVLDLGFTIATERIKGEEFSTVDLTLIRASDGKEYKVSIVRRALKVELVQSEIINGNIGYIRIPSFEVRGVDVDFAEAIARLRDASVQGLVIDIRDNSGGRMEMMTSMLDLLLPAGNIIIRREKSGAEVVTVSDNNRVEMPIAVIINANSYSAAEFFAACLQEYEWAEIVGQKSTGKGYAQTTSSLKDGTGILLSTQEYFTPKGVSLANVGVTPDIVVEMTDVEKASLVYNVDHAGDSQFNAAIDFITQEIAG